MKKMFVLLIAILAIGFMGCDNGSTGGDDNSGKVVAEQYRGIYECTTDIPNFKIEFTKNEMITYTKSPIDSSISTTKTSVFSEENTLYNSDYLFLGTFQDNKYSTGGGEPLIYVKK